MARSGGYWREAATIVIAAKNNDSSGESKAEKDTNLVPFNYKILMLKRSKKNTFLPENYVFPGGTISEADFDAEWVTVFEKFTKKSLSAIVQQFKDRKVLPPVFINRPSSVFPAEIAFRICALRECFEECGILLVRDVSNNSTRILSSADLNSGTWRKRVHGDAGQFLSLCVENGLVPDIWCLREWCNWLTPHTRPVSEPPKKPRRFDTIFYVCCLDSQPEARVDNRETTTAQWQSPAHLLQLHYSGKIQMISPQLMELSRFCNFPQLSALSEFASAREVHGLQRWMPVVLLCEDGVIILLPGDGLYPEHPDVEGRHPPQMADYTMEAAKTLTPHWNRSQRSSMGVEGRVADVLCNIPQPCGQVAPVHKIHIDGSRL